MKARTVRLWSVVHTWSSLISTLFLLLLCLTGLPLIFYHEIDELLGYAPFLAALLWGEVGGYVAWTTVGFPVFVVLRVWPRHGKRAKPS